MSESLRVPARVLAALTLPAALAACATAPPPTLRTAQVTAPAAPDPTTPRSTACISPGRRRWIDGANDTAAFYLDQRAAPARRRRSFLKERAFAAALLISGDVDRAATLAPQAGEGDAAAYALGRVTRAVVELANDHGKAASDLLSGADMGAHDAAASLLRPWAAAAYGNWTAAVAPLTDSHDRAIQAFGDLNHALLLERAGKLADADAAYQAMSVHGGVFALAYGGFLERRGRRDAAVALYDEGLSKDPTDPAFTAARARASAKAAPPPAPSIKRGAGRGPYRTRRPAAGPEASRCRVGLSPPGPAARPRPV